MGDPDKIDADPIDMEYTTNPDLSFVSGYMEVDVNWVLIRENVLDLTHIAFLHANTFKQNDWDEQPDVYMDGDTVVILKISLSPLSPLFCAGFGWRRQVVGASKRTHASLAVPSDGTSMTLM